MRFEENEHHLWKNPKGTKCYTSKDAKTSKKRGALIPQITKGTSDGQQPATVNDWGPMQLVP